ncbi:polysaccharide biosynthesis protein [Flavobacteriales bacterium]|nr:polysaccharide biosynthesis protein [Flavobacteriales bacterium]
MKFPDWYVPKKIILLFDIFLTLISLILAYLIRFDLIGFYDLFWISEYSSIIWGVPTLILVRYITFLIGKTHKGIIRYLSTEDTLRIFYVVSTGTLLICFISAIRYLFIDSLAILPKSVIIIEYLGTLFFMLTSRFAVKLLFDNPKKINNQKINILIYGSGKMGIATKKSLEKDENSNYDVKGFIDDDRKKEGLLIERKTIIHSNNLEEIIRDLKIDAVIVAIKDPDTDNKRYVIELCLREKIKIKNVPSLDDWYDGDFSTKQLKNIKIEDLLGRKPIRLLNENIKEEFNEKTILISGAAGSIGSEIVRQVIKHKPKKVILLDQSESGLYDLNQELLSKDKNYNLEIVVGDITRKERMKNLFNKLKPEIVFHAAAYKHVPLMEVNPSEAIRTNVEGTKILADLSIKINVEKFIFISTDKAVNPTNVMGASKRISEMYCQSLSKTTTTKFITTRFGNVLGSSGSVIPLFQKQLENGGPITVTHESVTRYFMTIPEACRLVLEAGHIGEGGEIYVFDMGKSIKIIDLAKKMIQLAGLEIGKDIMIKITGLRPGEKMYEELLGNDENTIGTHHPKIMIGRVKQIDYNTINKLVENLISLVKSQGNEDIVKSMKQIVPEFISNNSEFSKLDN